MAHLSCAFDGEEVTAAAAASMVTTNRLEPDSELVVVIKRVMLCIAITVVPRPRVVVRYLCFS